MFQKNIVAVVFALCQQQVARKVHIASAARKNGTSACFLTKVCDIKYHGPTGRMRNSFACYAHAIY